jgi:hypothetical protein
MKIIAEIWNIPGNDSGEELWYDVETKEMTYKQENFKQVVDVIELSDFINKTSMIIDGKENDIRWHWYLTSNGRVQKRQFMNNFTENNTDGEKYVKYISIVRDETKRLEEEARKLIID